MVQQDAKGHFVKGHTGGPGRAPKAVEEDFKALMDACITDDDWKEMLGFCMQRAKSRGATAQPALEFLANRRFGKVKEQLELSGGVKFVWDLPTPELK